SSDSAPSSTRINIHSPQLHSVGRGALQTECADHLIVLGGHPEAAVALAVIGTNSVNLLSQCTLDVGFKGVAEVRRTEEPIDRDEQRPHLGNVIVRKRANCDLGAQVGLPPTQCARGSNLAGTDAALPSGDPRRYCRNG